MLPGDRRCCVCQIAGKCIACKGGSEAVGVVDCYIRDINIGIEPAHCADPDGNVPILIGAIGNDRFGQSLFAIFWVRLHYRLTVRSDSSGTVI